MLHRRTTTAAVRSAWIATAVVGIAGVGRAQVLLQEWNGSVNQGRFGSGAAMVGDLDGDGFGDVAIGEPYGVAPGNLGHLYAYSGRTGAQIWQVPGEHANDSYGWAVTRVGDVNLDGVPDVAVSAKGNYVHVLSGRDPTKVLYRFSPSTATNIGTAIAGVGDVNQDGWPDLVVADFSDNGNRGKVYFYSGKTGANLFTLSGENAGDQFGSSVAGIGDCNGDGFPDFAVGALNWSGSYVGRVYVYGGPNCTLLWKHDGGGGEFGYSVAGAGDFNHDGHPDVIVGAPNLTPNGKAVVLSGTDGSQLAAWEDGTQGQFGTAVAPAGDVDKDGYADVAVGAPYSATGPEVFLYSGRDQSILRTIAWAPTAVTWGAGLDGGVDADGDGNFDLVVTGPNYNGSVDLLSIAYLPEIMQVTPDRGRYTGGAPVTISGLHFQRSSVQVTIGGVPAGNVQVVNDTTLTVTAPVNEPGSADVVVTTDIGVGVAKRGFWFTPAMLDPTGDFRPGGNVVNTYLCDPKDTIYAIYGVDPGAIPIPPLHGVIGIDPYYVLIIKAGWPFDTFVEDDNLPADPSISGLTVLCQAVIGPKLAGKHRDGAATNLVSFVIQ